MQSKFLFCLLLPLLGTFAVSRIVLADNAVPVTSQSNPADYSSFSFRARPKQRCGAYFVAETALLLRAVNSQKTTDLYHRDGTHQYGEDFALPIAGQANIGLMINISRSASLGLVGFGTLEERRPRAGIKARYRFWEWVGTAIDIECGVAADLAKDDFSKELNRRQWVVGGLSLSHTQFIHFVFQLESWLQDFPPKRRTSAAYVGLRFGY